MWGSKCNALYSKWGMNLDTGKILYHCKHEDKDTLTLTSLVMVALNHEIQINYTFSHEYSVLDWMSPLLNESLVLPT